MSVAKLKPLSSGNEPAIGLERNARKHVAESLAQVLSATYMTQLKTQYYHWNVTGTHFSSLHLLFEGQYNDLFTAVDEIAERIRSLGFTTPGTFAEFSAMTDIKEDKSLPSSWEAMVQNLLHANELLARELRENIGIVQEAGDEGTADLFIRRMQVHEKAAWMLRSYLG